MTPSHSTRCTPASHRARYHWYLLISTLHILGHYAIQNMSLRREINDDVRKQPALYVKIGNDGKADPKEVHQ